MGPLNLKSLKGYSLLLMIVGVLAGADASFGDGITE